MTLPFAGHPLGTNPPRAKDEKDLIQSAYRFLIADLMPFGTRAEIRFEHGPENLSTEHYESVTYWYGLPAPSLIKTDSIDIGDPDSEKTHNYYSPEASDVEVIESRYEWGINFFPHFPSHASPPPGYEEYIGKEIFPSHEQSGRYTRGESYFTFKLDPANLGVLLRRTLDYSFPNQTDEIYVSNIEEAHSGNLANLPDAEWKLAGTWYLAGSSTVLFSNPRGELEKRELRTKTSNRRFRDDEFLIPAHLTKKSSLMVVKVKFIPDNQLLFPEFPFPKESAWSELKYDVYNYVIPDFNIK